MKTGVILTAALLAMCAVSAQAHWDESMPAKWVQMPDLAPTGMDVNCTFQDPYAYILADDFLCTETGAITDIHIWGSWWHDILPYDHPANVAFTLSIHEDIPAYESPTGYSMPGELLWVMNFEPGAFAVQSWAENLEEGWYDPGQNYDPMGDSVCWQYNFSIDEAEAFVQDGTEENPKVYWLDVQAVPLTFGSFFGWKTSLDHWNDDAVSGIGAEPNIPVWDELVYPPDHPMYPESIDLAFVIGGGEDEVDWGDAPEPTYPTTSGNNGASHTILPTLRLGQLIDAEPDGQPDPAAMGDDINNLPDEDGIVFTTPLAQGTMATVQVDLTASSGGVLDAWIDFDGSGNWDAANEYVIVGQSLPGGVMSTLPFPVPPTAQPGLTFARFRLTSTGVSSPTGAAPDGEVEDYEVFVEGEEWKWFQAPDLDDTGIDINGTEPLILADDYLCTAPGRLTEIHVWGSWKDDYLPLGVPFAVDFTVSIHEDIPADTLTGEHSRPGDVLWFRDFVAGEFTVDLWQDQLSEGWMTPPDDYYFPGDSICWLYTFFVPPAEAFHQVGMPDSGVVYWLDVQARPHDQEAVWGWKTSLDHWNDDSVWGTGAEPYFGPWSELRYPPQHALADQSIDLAFGLRMNYGTGVPDEIQTEGYGLRQNAPNPFNPRTTIQYDVPVSGGHVTIGIYDVAGRLVRVLVDDVQSEGPKSVEWDGCDEAGKRMASGVYFYRMAAPGVESSRKMLLLK